MKQLICASLSHAHYCYEVDILKESAGDILPDRDSPLVHDKTKVPHHEDSLWTVCLDYPKNETARMSRDFPQQTFNPDR